MLDVMLLSPTPPSVGGIANWTKMVTTFLSSSKDVCIHSINVGSNKRESFKRNLIQRIVYGLQDSRVVLRQMKQEFAKSKIDLIHFTTTGSLSLFRDWKIIRFAKKHKIPLVMHIRMGRMVEISQKKSFEWYVFNKLFKKVDKIITIDNNTRVCLNHVCPNKIIEILNPVDSKKIESINIKEHSNNGVLTFVGWVVKTKGIEELLIAFKTLKEKNDSLRLQIVGPYDDKYLNYLKENFDMDGVYFLGPKKNEECLKIVNESELFLFPSYSEGCPNAVLEAMLCKTPIIASNVGSIPELLANECGVLIRSKNVDDIVEKVEFLLSNQQTQLILLTNAFNKVINDLSIKCATEKYIKVWKEVVNG